MPTPLDDLYASEAEMQQEAYVFLRALQREIDPTDDDGCDVRLQLFDDGSFDFHSGAACYDTDHRGFWGSSVVLADDDDAALMATARDLVEQALDHAAEVLA